MKKGSLAAIIVLGSMLLSSSHCMAGWPKTEGTRCWELYRYNTGEKLDGWFMKLRIVREAKRVYRVSGYGELNPSANITLTPLSGTALRDGQNIVASMGGSYRTLGDPGFSYWTHFNLIVIRDSLEGTLSYGGGDLGFVSYTVKPMACKLLN